MIDTENSPAFARYVVIEDLYFALGTQFEKLEEIQATKEYQVFECLLINKLLELCMEQRRHIKYLRQNARKHE